MKLSVAISALLLTACAAPLGGELRRRVDELLPRGGQGGAALLRTPVVPVSIRYRAKLDHCVAYSRGRSIVLGPRATKDNGELALTLAHELAHVGMRERRLYRALPPVVQEGIAIWVSILVTERHVGEYARPPAYHLGLIYGLTLSEYQDLPSDFRVELEAGAVWVAQHLIHDGCGCALRGGASADLAEGSWVPIQGRQERQAQAGPLSCLSGGPSPSSACR